MKKKRPKNWPPKHHEGENDTLQAFLMANGTVRGTLLIGRRMINQMRWNHELGILETLFLGHAYMGACLMAAGLQRSDRLALQVECSGPIKGPFPIESRCHHCNTRYMFKREHIDRILAARFSEN